MADSKRREKMISETVVLQDVFPSELMRKILEALPLRSLVCLKCVDKESYRTVDAIFFFFPVNVIREILLRLPVKSLLRLKCVSKKWFDLIHDPFFMGPHLQRSLDYYSDTARITLIFISYTGVYLMENLNSPSSKPTRLEWLQPYNLNYSRLKVVGSCNGLVCIETDPSEDRTFYICNPSTRAFEEFPDPGLEPDMPHTPSYLAGFGHDVENDDYKVVMVHSGGEDMFVYSLKANSWRRPSHQQRPKDCLDLNLICGAQHSVFLNSRVHWIIFGKKPWPQIAAFDICSEEWNTLPGPIYNQVSPPVQIHGILQIHGCLCACVGSPSSGVTDIWMMKEYGVQASWNKLASIPTSSNIFPAYVTYTESERGCKLLFTRLTGYANLLWYDSEQEALTEFEIDTVSPWFVTFGVFVESLASVTGTRSSVEE